MLLERDVYRCDSTRSNGARRGIFLCYSQGRGNNFLCPGDIAGPVGGLPDLACPAVALVRATQTEHGSRLLRPEGCGSVSLQRCRAGTGTESRLADGVRAAEL